MQKTSVGMRMDSFIARRSRREAEAICYFAHSRSWLALAAATRGS